MSSVFHKFDNFTWEGVKKIGYKPVEGDAPVTFFETTRQNIVEQGENTAFHMRYFECAPGGYSSLEKHAHVHVVVIARGKGKVIVNDEIFDAAPMDVVVVPPLAPHQFINAGQEAFGFFCTVDAERDRFMLLTRDEIEGMKKNPEVAAHIQVHEQYFGGK